MKDKQGQADLQAKDRLIHDDSRIEDLAAKARAEYEAARQPVERYLSEAKSYQRNKWSLGKIERQRIEERWGEVIRHYGYQALASGAA